MDGNPVAVVTGASRGIGRAVTLSLASEGFDIAAIARSLDSEGMETLGPEVEKHGVSFFPIGLDITCTSCHKEVVSNILERYKRIDLLVSNPGVAPIHSVDLLDMTEEGYDRVLNINLKGPVFFIQKIAKEMIWLKQIIQDYTPRIVIISSISAVLSSTDRGEYCISKAGLSMASTLFAGRLSKEGILVFEVRPGVFEADMKARIKDKNEKVIANDFIPQERWGLPNDISKAVSSLARGDWDFSTGAVFEISGGLNIRKL
jgi:NAD(P)-dependent dehydrogenase (short-subunit alcohol dehydrogenase family)